MRDVNELLEELRYTVTLKVNETVDAQRNLQKANEYPYKLRQFIEGEQRKGTDSATILNDVLLKLKQVTPHGPENKIDA
jgi:uncharacterized protein (DUF2344 family)